VTNGTGPSELAADDLVAHGVLDDAGALPDAEEPGQRDELGGEAGRDLDHAARGQRWPRKRL
jgi:hypothetical protein